MAIEKLNASSSLAEVVDRILDKGVVVDAWARVSLVGIELLAIEARVVVAGVDTYLRYAEAVGLTAIGVTANAATACPSGRPTDHVRAPPSPATRRAATPRCTRAQAGSKSTPGGER